MGVNTHQSHLSTTTAHDLALSPALPLNPQNLKKKLKILKNTSVAQAPRATCLQLSSNSAASFNPYFDGARRSLLVI